MTMPVLLCNLLLAFLTLLLGTGKASAFSGTVQLAVPYVQDQEIERWATKQYVRFTGDESL
jgi:hypothetical protein